MEPLIPELDDYRRQFEQIREETARLVEGLNYEQFNWRPGPGQWSIAECLGHLFITGEAQRRGVDTAMERAHARGLTGRPPFRYPVLQRWILAATAPGSKRRFRAPRRFHPVGGQPVTAVVPTFLHLQRQFLDRIEQANGLDLARVKVVTPISRYYRFCLGMVFAQVAAHERRHLLQARRVREHANFPKSLA
jgi:hypothetical protein